MPRQEYVVDREISLYWLLTDTIFDELIGIYPSLTALSHSQLVVQFLSYPWKGYKRVTYDILGLL